MTGKLLCFFYVYSAWSESTLGYNDHITFQDPPPPPTHIVLQMCHTMDLLHMGCVREPFFDLMIITATWLCAYY